MSTQTEVKAPPEILKGLAGIRNIVLLAIVGVLVTLWSYSYLFTPTIPSTWFIGGVWFIILSELLARVNKKFRVSPAALVLFMFPMMMFGSKTWWTNGGSETNFQTTMDQIMMTMVGLPNTSPSDFAILNMYIPSWLIPNDIPALRMAWTGLAPGAEIPWNIWIGPIVGWSFLALVNYAYNMFFVFSFLGPHWDDKEKLLFPLALPTVYMINESAGARDPLTGKSRLFDWKNPTSKAFWIAFIIGVIISIPYVLAAMGSIVPPPWFGWYFNTFLFNSGNELTQSFLPGAGLDGIILPTWVMIYIILPYDIMITVIIAWFLFRVLYDMAMIRFGYIAFTPGAGEWTYGVIGPLPWVTWGYTGLTIGFALWLWWSARSRIIEGIRSLGKGPNPDEGGMSMRTKFIGLIVTAVLSIISYMMVGVNWLIAILMLLFWSLSQTAFARTFSELYIFGPVVNYWQWQFTQPVGQAIGVYGPAPSVTGPKVAETLLSTTVPGLSRCGIDNSGVGIAGMTTTYKVIRGTNTNMKDAVKWILIFGVIAVPLSFVWNIYLFYHLGGSNLSPSWLATGCLGAVIFGSGVTSNSWQMSSITSNMWIWAIFGIIVMFIMGFLRTRYTWFFLNPMAFIAQLTGSPYFPWLDALVALPIKYILIHALGPSRTEKYLIPVFVGFAFGSNCLLIVTSGWLSFTIGIQRAISMWH